jgi:hypothetical protein
MNEILIIGFAAFALLMSLVSLFISSRNKVDETLKDKFIINFTINKNDKQKIDSFKAWAEKEGVYVKKKDVDS